MLEHLDIWLAVITLGFLAWYELRLNRVVMPIVRFLYGAGREMASKSQQARAARLRPSPLRRTNGQFNGSAPAETKRNEDEIRFDAISSIAIPKDDAETVAFRFLARLVKAGHVTETQALESACGLKAGSSKAYQEARTKLKKALEDIEVAIASP